MSDPIQATFSLMVWTRYRNCCVCGDPGSEAHHVIFKGQLGDNLVENGVMLCMGHHRRMHAMDEETRRAIGFHIKDDRPDVIAYVVDRLGYTQGWSYLSRTYFIEEDTMSEAPQPGHVDAARVVAYEDAAGEFRWKAFDTNNKEVADSGEGYVDKDYAKKAATDLFPDAKFEFEWDIDG